MLHHALVLNGAARREHIGSERPTCRGPRSATAPSFPPPLHGAMPVVLPPKVARLDIHTRPAHQQVFGFSGVIFALGNGRQLSPGGCCALTNEGANTLISQPMMTVSAISPSIGRMATTLVLSQPTLDVLGRLFLFLFLGCDPQHNPRAGGPTFANHWPHSQILCLAYFVCSTVAAQNIRGATKWGLTKMARRQTETTYLKAVLFWLQEYWTG